MSVPTTNADTGSVSAIAEISAKHCIFQCGESHYAVSATAVREVELLPPLVPVPRCPSSIAGICHIRSEFVPVVSVNPILGLQDSKEYDSGPKQVLVLNNTLGSWALMIDRVIAIDSIETHVDGGHRNEVQLAPVMGTASYRSQVIRVLDPKVLHRIAQQSLHQEWNSQSLINRSQSIRPDQRTQS